MVRQAVAALEEREMRARILYDEFDTNNDGKIQPKELGVLLSEMYGSEIPDMDLNEMSRKHFSKADKNADGVLRCLQQQLLVSRRSTLPHWHQKPTQHRHRCNVLDG